MTSADDRIRAIFAELTEHFMKTGNMGADAARLTAATVMLRRARMAMRSDHDDHDVSIESQTLFGADTEGRMS